MPRIRMTDDCQTFIAETHPDAPKTVAAFAQLLLANVGEETALLRRSHRDAGFFVLLAPDVPAVLLEMGFITNPEDEAFLTNKASRRGMLREMLSNRV